MECKKTKVGGHSIPAYSIDRSLLFSRDGLSANYGQGGLYLHQSVDTVQVRGQILLECAIEVSGRCSHADLRFLKFARELQSTLQECHTLNGFRKLQS
jgi:hypothetical protein